MGQRIPKGRCPAVFTGDMAVWNRESGTVRGILMYSLPEQNPQVLQQYLESHENEDGAACQLGLGFIAASKCASRLLRQGHGHVELNCDALIKDTAGRMSTFRKAKVTPTASASMLVAMARSTMFLTSRSGFGHSSSLLKDSFIMFAPITASRMKATQWS